MSDNFVRVFKFEHRAERKTRTWKTRTIWSKKSDMSEFLTWPKLGAFLKSCGFFYNNAIQFTCGHKQNRIRQIKMKGKEVRTKGYMLIVSTQSDQQLWRLDN